MMKFSDIYCLPKLNWQAGFGAALLFVVLLEICVVVVDMLMTVIATLNGLN